MHPLSIFGSMIYVAMQSAEVQLSNPDNAAPHKTDLESCDGVEECEEAIFDKLGRLQGYPTCQCARPKRQDENIVSARTLYGILKLIRDVNGCYAGAPYAGRRQGRRQGRRLSTLSQ